MSNKVFLPLVFVICFYASYCSSIKCYDCSSLLGDSSCADKFNKGQNQLKDNCTQCMKTKAAISGIQVVFRSCMDDVNGANECKKEKHNGMDTHVCLCSTDGCNAATSVHVTIATILAPVLMLVWHVL